MNHTNTVTIVLPCHNESAALPLVLRDIEETALIASDLDFHVLVVDDGSSDMTLSVFKEYRSSAFRKSSIKLLVNQGKEKAVALGIRNAAETSSQIVVMDSDGQHVPSFMLEMIRAAQESQRVCIAERTKYKRGARGAFAVLILRTLARILGVWYEPSYSEYVVIPRSVSIRLAQSQKLGVVPLLTSLHEIDSVFVVVKNDVGLRHSETNGTRWTTAGLWRKALLQLISDPWKVLPRIATIIFFALLLTALYGLFIGLQSIRAGTFLGVGSVIVVIVLLVGALFVLLVFIVAVSLLSLDIASNRTKDVSVEYWTEN